jgi:dTDP-4-dehydrorhamnose reductase
MEKFLIFGKDSTLAGFFLNEYGKDCTALTKKDCDITDAKKLEKNLKKSPAKYVINCAAITDIKYCEANPSECYKVNTMSVFLLSKLCGKYNKKLINVSSDYAVNPVNIYGYSKFMSELIINPKKDLLVRTSFYSPNYYSIKSLLAGTKTKVYKNMFFNPVSVTRLVREIYKNKDKTGILNIFTDKKISKYEFAKKAAKYCGINKKLITPANYFDKTGEVKLPLDSFIKSDIKISLDEDLKLFAQSLK